MSTSEVSDLLFERLEANAGRYAAIQNLNFGLGIPHDRASEYHRLPREQEQLRGKWIEALKREGKIAELPKQSTGSLRVENRGTECTVYLFGSIGGDYGGTSAEAFRDEFMRIPPTATVRLIINSDGGAVSDALAMRAVINSHAGRVIAEIAGVAASAATLVMSAANRIKAARGSTIMIHPVRATFSGGAKDFENAVKIMHDTDEAIELCYVGRWKGTRDELRKALDSESYYTPHEAQSLGLIDEVTDELAVAAHGDVSRTENPTLSIAACGSPSKFLTGRRGMVLHRIATIRDSPNQQEQSK